MKIILLSYFIQLMHPIFINNYIIYYLYFIIFIILFVI